MEFAKEYFGNFVYRRGDKEGRREIIDGYVQCFEELPPIQYVKEAKGDTDAYFKLLLGCLVKGKPYEMSAEVKREVEKLEEDGVVHDGFC